LKPRTVALLLGAFEKVYRDIRMFSDPRPTESLNFACALDMTVLHRQGQCRQKLA